MLLNNNTIHLYLADTLPTKLPTFFKKFEKALKECKINYSLIPSTKDIWAVDYMPIQIGENRLVQFVYNPDYLQPKKYSATISDVDAICVQMGIRPIKSTIVLDGGNVIRQGNKVIMTDKIFKENPTIPKGELIQALMQVLEIEQLIIIPRDPADFTGHADGMVRFVNANTVVINDYSIDNPKLQKRLHKALNNANMDIIPIPYCPHATDADSAHGVYTNFLQFRDLIFLPAFGIPEDKIVTKQFEDLFPCYTIRAIDCTGLAPHGGLLNCISWELK